jgi:multiple sugar transport system permease protein
MNKKLVIGRSIITYFFLTLAVLIMIVPLLWMISTSLKTRQYTLQVPPRFIPEHPNLESYRKLFSLFPMMKMLMNSIFVAFFVTSGQIITSIMAAYAFARMRFKGREVLFIVFLATMMVPYQVTIIPLFITMRYFGWLNTYPGLIVPVLHSAFGTFLLRQALITIPGELEESAFMDGANHFFVFSRIIVPLAKPAIATLGVLSFMSSWNSFLWPLIVSKSDQMMTLPVGLAALHGRYETQWNLVMAGGVISLVPIVIVFLFSQRYFIQGISRSGIKS